MDVAQAPPSTTPSSANEDGGPVPLLPRSVGLAPFLLLLVILSAVPFLILTVFITTQLLRAERQAVMDGLMTSTRTLAAAVEAEVRRHVAIVETLSHSTLLQAGDLTGFRSLAEGALPGLPDVRLVVADPAGQQLLSTERPAGTPLPVRRHMDLQKLAFETGRTQVSDVREGRSGRQAVWIEVPVFRSGQPAYVLILAFDPSRFARLLREARLGEGRLAAVLDRQGRFIARLQDHEARVGTLATKSWLDEIAKRPEAQHGGISLEGDPYQNAYVTTEHGWVVGIAVTDYVLSSSWRRSAWVVGSMGTLSLLLSLSIAIMGARRIIRPAQALAEGGKVDQPQSALSHIREFDAISGRLIEQRDEARREAGERQRAEDHTRLLMREVNHRAKNLLVVVEAIAKRSASDNFEEFMERFQKRLRALARNQDLLVRNEWKSISINELAASQLSHLSDFRRIHTHGPHIEIDASASQALGMALHELATNSAKYGALSASGGEVRLVWELLKVDGMERFSMTWTEQGGPLVARPLRSGFGSSVISDAVTMSLAGEVTLEFRPTGLRWNVVCPVTNLSKNSTQAGETAPVAVLPESSASIIVPPEGSASGKRVLVVEDEPLVGMDVVSILENAGLETVGPAASVAEALTLLRSSGCDCAVLDVNLGAETSDPIALALRSAGIPFVVVSGYARDQHSEALMGAPFLSKPIDQQALASTVLQCLKINEKRPAPGACHLSPKVA